jgi:hypothetical protein
MCVSAMVSGGGAGESYLILPTAVTQIEPAAGLPGKESRPPSRIVYAMACSHPLTLCSPDLWLGCVARQGHHSEVVHEMHNKYGEP